jgi:NADH dehydrogenase [ubiquinone] 1 alpha subcomplex assembly factor 1
VRRLTEGANDVYTSLRGDFAPLHHLEVHSFANGEDIGRFQVTTDRVLGGATDASLSVKPYANFTAGLFTGVVDYKNTNPDSRGGFAAFRTKPDERERDLDKFQALEMRIKTDGRRYIVNLKAQDHSPEHLWQMAVMAEPHAWTTVAVPFSQLVLTRRGRVDIAQSPLNRSRLNGFGILLADGHNGPFKFEIQWLRAIRDFTPAAYDPMPMHELEARAAAAGERAAGQLAKMEAAVSLERGQGDGPSTSSRQKLIDQHRLDREAAKGGGA